VGLTLSAGSAQSNCAPWLWPNLLSLDAPLVAVLWQTLFLRCLGAPVRWLPAAVLFLAVWLIYVADRMLDTYRLHSPAARHLFYRRHFRPVLAVWCCVLPAAAILAAGGLTSLVLVRGFGMLAAVGVYLCVVHALHSDAPRTGLKETAVALLFALGTSLTAWDFIHTWSDALTIVLFSALCWLNCVAIEQWEAGPDEWRVGRIAAFVALVGLVLLHRHRPILASAEAMSLLALTLLDRFHKRLSKDALRVLADAALLSPLLFLPALR
jgi:hypothetical protein